MNILITGGTGYIGGHLARALASQGCRVTVLARHAGNFTPVKNVSLVEAPDYHEERWNGASVFAGHDAVIHAAARVHIRRGTKGNDAIYRRDNVDFALRMAGLAEKAGVRRFVFISTIGAQVLDDLCHQGRITFARAWKEFPYRASKREAEKLLLAQKKDMAVICVRLPGVYGPGAPGSFSLLLRMIRKRLPMPFGGLTEPRAFVGIDTICDFMGHALARAPMRSGVVPIRDADQISVRDFILETSRAANLPRPWLLNYSPGLLRFAAGCIGYGMTALALTEPARVDLSVAESLLQWRPKQTIRQGLGVIFQAGFPLEQG